MMKKAGITIFSFCLVLLVGQRKVLAQEKSITEIPLAPKEYRRPADFKPFHYRYSIKELQEKFSSKQMELAERQDDKVKKENEQGQWKPTRQSLNQHQIPEWWRDAKLGMFVDWGPWSIPGWAPHLDGAMYPDHFMDFINWYKPVLEYMAKNWGKDFTRDDFVSLFKAKEYQPKKLVKIAKEAGMKYIIPFAKHHGGYCLWPSSYTQRSAEYIGPKKDLIGPMVKEARRQGLKFGFYFSIEDWEYPIIKKDGTLEIRRWEKEDVPYDEKFENMISGKIPVKDFTTDYLIPQATEFIDKYDPDILWYDGDWSTQMKKLKTMNISAYFYNHAAGRKEVAVNDRYGMIGDERSRFQMGNFYVSEYNDFKKYADKVKDKKDYAWEETRGLSQSFGFNWQDTDDNILSSQEFLKMFLNIVSHGGNLLLIVNLDGQGAMPGYEKERLRDIGKWLKVNGEGIYATRPYETPVEDNIYFTRSKDKKKVYAISMGWSGKQLVLNTVQPKKGSEIYLLGYKKPLSWSYKEGKTVIQLPEKLQNETKRPCNYAYTFKIKID